MNPGARRTAWQAWAWAGLLAMGMGAASAAGPGDLPGFEAVRAAWQSSDATLLDRQGQPLASQRIHTQARRLDWVALNDVSPALLPALLQAEDQRFDQHHGVDWLAVAHALVQKVQPGSGGAPRGASSITMQLAALLDPALARPGAPRKLGQKWQQIDAALGLESHWSKAQILEAYLNLVSYRGELQGLAAASWGLFNKAPSGLGHAESALLAALIRAPQAPSATVARRACLILARTQADAPPCDAAVLAVVLDAASMAPRPVAALAPHSAARLLQQPGPLRSGLDARIQRLATQALMAQLAELRNQGAEDGAVVVLDNRTGQVLAHVGSGGAGSRAALVDAADSPRQAGSTLKPFLYAQAFDARLLSPASLLDNSALALPTDAGLYVPQNYDRQSGGVVSVRQALASSLNLPAVRTLGLVGVPGFHRTLTQLGLRGLHPDPSHYGPSLALGSADVRLIDLTNAYRTLANGGLHSPVRWLPDEPAAAPQRVFSPASAWLVGHILADNRARASTFGLDSVLATPFWSAVKTGTSKDMRDNWCIGWSEQVTVGVWVGNASGSPMHDVSGVSGAAPAWADVMRGLHRHMASRPPAPPAGVVARSVVYEGHLEAGRTEWFASALAPPARPQPYRVSLSAPELQAPRITAPLDGTLIAWDPDIPPRLQGLVAHWQGDAPGARWQLDDQVLDDAAAGRLPLRPGRHRLRLLGADGQVLDEVGFEVRGMPAQAAQPG